MGTRERILLLIFCIYAATSRRRSAAAAAAPCSPSPPQLPYSSLNSCPDNLIPHIIDALACTPPSLAPPRPHDGGDLSPGSDTISDQELSTATFAEVVVRTFSASIKEGRYREILFTLMFPVAAHAVLFCGTPLRNLCPRFALERLLVILFVNAITAFLLPAGWRWIPAVCSISSLLIIIVVPLLL